MTETLWLRFAEDTSLPDSLNPDAQIRLARIFDDVSPDSDWNKALGLIGLHAIPHKQGLLKWVKGTPYINWSHLVAMVGAGAVTVIKTPDGAYTYKVRYTPQSVLGLMASQWKVSRFLIRFHKKTLPDAITGHDKISLSLALGQALLALTLRLPSHTPEQLAGWLRETATLPRGLKKTVEDILFIQQSRTSLSDAWLEIFPRQKAVASAEDYPAFFWDTPTTLHQDVENVVMQDRWKGLPVSGAVATGRACIVGWDGALPDSDDPLVLIFPRARPETTELFSAGVAILYAEGGVMSHACTVAREQGTTCVTAVGRDFLAQIGKLGSVWLSVDGSSGEIKVIK